MQDKKDKSLCPNKGCGRGCLLICHDYGIPQLTSHKLDKIAIFENQKSKSLVHPNQKPIAQIVSIEIKHKKCKLNLT